jgi:hypothetical protein
MSSYNTRSRLYTVDYRIKGEKDKIGLTARKMKENNKEVECTEIPGIAAHCARSHSLRIFQHRMVMILVCSDLSRFYLIFSHLKFWESADGFEALRIDDRRLATLVLDQMHGTCSLVSHINVDMEVPRIAPRRRPQT